jgi:hypothetical protein
MLQCPSSQQPIKIAKKTYTNKKGVLIKSISARTPSVTIPSVNSMLKENISQIADKLERIAPQQSEIFLGLLKTRSVNSQNKSIAQQFEINGGENGYIL